MNIVLNKEQNGFAERIPNETPSYPPFHIGERVAPTVGDWIFVEPKEHEVVNTRLAEYYGLKIGELMTWREYFVEAA